MHHIRTYSSRARTARARLLFVPAAALFLLGAACGGDDEDTTAGGETESTDTTAAESSDGALEATSGTGEITIGGTTYEFTSENCAVGEGDTPLVEVTGKGNTGGKEYEIEIIRSRPTDNYVERSKLAFSGVIASVATQIRPGEDAVFQVEGREVTATGLQFTGVGGAPSGDGSFSIICDDIER